MRNCVHWYKEKKDLLYFCLQGLQKRRTFVFLDQWRHGFCLGLEGTRCPPCQETKINTSEGLCEWKMHTVEESTRLGRAIKALYSFSDSIASLSNEKRQKLRALTSIE